MARAPEPTTAPDAAPDPADSPQPETTPAPTPAPTAAASRASDHVPRPLAARIAAASQAIVLLEGAHGAGKTALVRNEPAFRAFHYVTLAEDATRLAAEENAESWLASLPQPVVIDDAHRVPDLGVALQRLAPQPHASGGPAFVLVSPRTLPVDLDAPAALQPARFTLFPFTQAELRFRPGNLIDDLFDAQPRPSFYSHLTRSELRTIVRVGGFPERALHPARALSHAGRARLTEQMRALIDDGAGPKADLDRLIEDTVLRKLLGNPGQPLGVDAMADACYLDTPTLTELLRAFADRHLIFALPILGRAPSSKRHFGKTRIHPIDSTFSIEILRTAGEDIACDPMTFSKVLRGFCANQLIPAAAWTSEPTQVCHWKSFERKVHRVDLVLARENRLIGVLVRNTASARHDGLGPLRPFMENPAFYRGFIFYTGRFVRQLSDNLWALPISSLWEYRAFDRPDDPYLAANAG